MQGLAYALTLRQEGKHEESRALILELLSLNPDDALLNYQCAWAHDLLGLEREAVGFYERALNLGLQEDREGAFIGLGSTYRCLGNYRQAEHVLRRGLGEFPENRALQVFLSMALYNLGQHGEAMEILLRNLAETTQDDDIKGYRRALLHYASQLDMVWS